MRIKVEVRKFGHCISRFEPKTTKSKMRWLMNVLKMSNMKFKEASNNCIVCEYEFLENYYTIKLILGDKNEKM